MDFKGSETEKNLYRAFAGESRANTKYELYAEKAIADGYRWVGEIFNDIAKQELAHAREAYGKYLDRVQSTKTNLIDCINSEIDEAECLYEKYGQIAKEEGFTEIAEFFEELQEVEEAHAQIFRELYKRIIEDCMFESSKEIKWCCLNCGYIHKGKEAPKVCPLCKYRQEYYKPCCEIEKM